MKNLFILLVIAAVLVGSNSGCKNQTNSTDANANLTLTVDSFLASPELWAGKEVVIAGTVSHVCKHSGKKLFLFSADPEKTVKVNAGGNFATFDIKYEGSDVEITGTVVEDEKIDSTYLNEWEAEIKKQVGDKDQKVCNAENSAIAGQTKTDSAACEKTEDPYASVKEFRSKLEKSGKPYIAIYAINVTGLKEVKKETAAN
jgi:hypothetical protein